MTDTRGRRISKPWYQREPYPTIVGALIAHELLAEGGTASLKLAARVAQAAREAPPGKSYGQIEAQLILELTSGHLVVDELPHDELMIATQDVLDILVEHGELLT